MAGNFNIKNANGKTLTIQNPDTNNADIVIDGSKIASTVSPELTGTPTVNGVSFSGYSGFKNYIINGGFNVNQYPAFSNSSDGYKFDRWLIVGAANIGAAVCGNLQNGVDGAITMSNKGLYFTKTGTGNAWISQRIEYPTKLSGRTVTLSFKAYSAVAMNTAVYFDSYNPTNGPTVDFGSLKQSFTLLVGWNTYSFTFKLPVIGANYTNIASYLQLNLELLLGSTTTSAWISDIQLEEGSVATPFEQRPIGLELSLCQRYYEVLGIGYGVAKDASSMILYFSASPKRIPPTGILLTSAPYGESPINIIARSATASTLATQMNQIFYGNGGYMCLVNGFNSMTANTNASFNANSIALSAEL